MDRRVRTQKKSLERSRNLFFPLPSFIDKILQQKKELKKKEFILTKVQMDAYKMREMLRNRLTLS